MSEKFQKIVNAPHRAVGKLGKKIKDTKPEKIGEKIARVAGETTAGMTQFLLWLAKYITLDNHITRGGEKLFSKIKVGKNKDGKDKKIPKFVQKNPNFTAIVSWWMLLATLYGGYKVGKDLSSDDSVIRAKIENVINELRHHDGEVEGFQLDPTADDASWKKQVDAIHPYVVAHIFSSEGFIADSYDDNGGKGTPTVGAGFTIDDEVHKKFAERVLERPVSSTNFHVTKSEARLLAESWLRDKVYPEIKKQFNKPLDYKLFTILAVAGYNRGERTYRAGNMGHPVCAAVNAGKSADEVLGAYIRAFGGTRATQWGGLANKYAVSAMYYTGDVRDTTILRSIAEAPYTLEKSVKKYQNKYPAQGQEPGRLLTYDKGGRVNGIIVPENINEMLLATTTRKTQGTYQEPVMNYLNPDEVDIIVRGRMFDSKPKEEIVHVKSDDVREKKEAVASRDFDSEYKNARNLYRAGKYDEAAKAYEALVAQYPDNALLRNNLSETYNKLERYKDAIAQAQQIVRRIGDKSQYATAQYNAGFAYEKLGDMKRALANYKLSAANGNKQAMDDVMRVQNILNNQSKTNASTTAFNNATAQVKKLVKNSTNKNVVKNGASRA